MEGSPRWLIASPMLSMYTLFIRIGMGHIAGTPFRETLQNILEGKTPSYLLIDKSRLAGSMNGINWIFAQGDRSIFPQDLHENYKDVGIGYFHNYGIMSFACGSTRKHFPNWWYVEDAVPAAK